MLVASRRARRWPIAACALVVAALTAAPADARQAELAWAACGDVPGVQCATQQVPLDYDRPNGRSIDIAVARVPAKDQANKIGSLFFNFGGPGAPTVDFLQATAGEGVFDALNQRFDIVGFDPRGVGQSSPAIDCDVNQETDGLYSQPFWTPLNLDREALIQKVRNY